jgi:hypothetical protein
MALSSPASRIVRPFVPGGSDSHAWLTASVSAALASSTATVGVNARVLTASATDADASLKPLRKA